MQPTATDRVVDGQMTKTTCLHDYWHLQNKFEEYFTSTLIYTDVHALYCVLSLAAALHFDLDTFFRTGLTHFSFSYLSDSDQQVSGLRDGTGCDFGRVNMTTTSIVTKMLTLILLSGVVLLQSCPSVQ